MTELQNCKRCGTTFPSNGLMAVCPMCKEKDDAEYDRIRGFLFQHPQAKIFEVASALNISIGRITRFLKEGRLEIVEANNAFLRCEMCGCPIQSGKHCETCLKQRRNEVKVTYIENTALRQETKITFLSRDSRGTRRFATR